MREMIILTGALILWTLAAQAVGSAPESNLDVLGSQANNTTIIAPEGSAIGVDIVGSTASNLQIVCPDASGGKCEKEIKECGPCGEEKVYNTPWDDFTRPLCYPWSSYIPTRYNRNFIRDDSGYMSTVPGPVTLGKGKTYS
ncbi:MAG TPA: hypothetical protein PKL29_04760 [Methanothrix sp.]|nr:hypothetical protein [Methanothrix sp.]